MSTAHPDGNNASSTYSTPNIASLITSHNTAQLATDFPVDVQSTLVTSTG